MKRHQSGQAMLEFLVAASFVMIPLITLLVYLGKVGDAQHRAYEGARYVAWEKTLTNKSTVKIANEANKRILYGLHREIDSGKDRMNNNNEAEKVDGLYRHVDDSGNYTGLLVKNNKSFAKASASNQRPRSKTHRFRDSLLGTKFAGIDFPAEFHLDEKGMLTATMQYEISKTRHLELPKAITPSAKNVIYTATWRQVSGDDVIGAMGDMVLGKLAFDNPVFDTMTELAGIMGNKEWAEFELGFIKPDVVPCSRVIGGGNDREAACY